MKKIIILLVVLTLFGIGCKKIDPITKMKQQGVLLATQGKTLEARDIFLKILSKNPLEEETLGNLAVVYVRIERQNAELGLYYSNLALQLNKFNLPVLDAKTYALAPLNRPQEFQLAIKELSDAKLLMGNRTFKNAQELFKNRRYAEALAQINQTAQLFPDSVQVRAEQEKILKALNEFNAKMQKGFKKPGEKGKPKDYFTAPSPTPVQIPIQTPVKKGR